MDIKSETGIPLVEAGKNKYYNEIPLDRVLAQKCINYTHMVARSMVGSFVTVSATSGTHKRALNLEKRFDAICENMEGAAIAHVCILYKVPFLEIRGISNIAGVRDKRRWRLKHASRNCQKAALEIIKKI